MSTKKKNKFRLAPPITYYTLVLDKSTSMRAIRSEVVKSFNERVRKIKEVADHEVRVSLLTFNESVNRVLNNKSVHAIHEINDNDYDPNGWTALWDGLGAAIYDLNMLETNPQDAFLVEVITDGDENRSGIYGSEFDVGFNGKLKGLAGRKNILDMLASCANKDNWTFAFQVPPGGKKKLVEQFKIPSDCVMEWENTKAGTQVATNTAGLGFQSYFGARSTGQLKVKKFYHGLDLQNVPVSDVKKMDNYEYKFQQFTLDKEYEIADFVRKKTGKDYIVGQAVFEVVKKEHLRHDREIYVQIRGKSEIYGGAQAKKLLGIPTDVDVELDPVNLSNFRIFINSRSHNRKLPRGSMLLIDFAYNKIVAPTWSSPKVTI